jgi:hypothetical protein
MDWDEMSNRYRGPPIDASYKVSVYLAKQFQRRRFFKISQSETRIACGVLIHLQTWLPQAIPVLDWSISKNLLI